MICAIRIHGDVNLKKDVRETLNRLRLRRKYSCIVVKGTKEQVGMIKSLKDYIAFGEIKKEDFIKLVEARGKLTDKTKKIDFKKISEEITNGKKYEELNLKPFFRLHPPRGGIDSKKHFGVNKGVLGDNKDKINELLGRML